MTSDELIKIEVEKTLNTARQIRRVDADPYLYQKISARLSELEQSQEPAISARGLKIGCTMIALLVFFNIYVLLGANHNLSVNNATVQNVFEEISGDISTYKGPYNY